MALNFNKDIFSALNSAGSFQSSSTQMSNNALAKSEQLKSRIQGYLELINLSPEPLEIASLSNTLMSAEAALVAYDGQVLTFQLHLESRIEGFLEDMQVAAAIKEIDSYIEQVPASCASINTIASTLTGAADASLNSTISIVLDVEASLDAVDSALEGNSDGITSALSNLDIKLASLTSNLKDQISHLANIESSDKKLLTDIYQTHKSMASTFALQSLLEDQCVKGLITQLAGDKLKNIIEEKVDEEIDSIAAVVKAI